MRYPVAFLTILLTLGAYSAPPMFSYQGRLFDTNGDPLNDGSAAVTLQVLSPSASCVLFEESHNVLMDDTAGFFKISVGLGTKNTSSAPDLALEDVFSNALTFNDTHLGCASYSPNSYDHRLLRVTINGETLIPDQVITSVPFSLQAGDAATLDGESSQDIKSYADENLAGFPLPNLSSSPLVAGDSFQWDGTKWVVFQPAPLDLPSNSVTVEDVDFASSEGINIPQASSDPGSPTAGQMYYNTTSNKVMVYNGSSWVEAGSSSVWTVSGADVSYSGGNVGIGTSSPTAIDTFSTLTVQGDGDYGQITAVSFDPTGGGDMAGVVKVVGSRGTAATPIALQDNDRFGLIGAVGYDGDDYNISASIDFRVDGTVGTSDLPSEISFYTTTDGDSSRSQKMVINSAGNIGVGTSNPADRFHVAGDARADGVVSSVNGGGNSIFIDGSDGAGGYGSRIRFGGSGTNANVLAIQGTGNTEFIRIDGTTGNIGIGTTTPDSKLEVVDTLSVSRAGGDQKIYIEDSGASGGFIKGISTENNKKHLHIDSVHDESSSAAGALGIDFRVGAESTPTTAMVIDESARVGIGTQSPHTELSIQGTDFTTLAISTTDSTDPVIQLTTDTANETNDWTIRNDVSAGDDLQIRYDNSSRMTMDASGNLGIGATNPQAGLHVEGPEGRFTDANKFGSYPPAGENNGFAQIISNQSTDGGGLLISLNDDNFDEKAIDVYNENTDQRVFSVRSGGEVRVEGKIFNLGMASGSSGHYVCRDSSDGELNYGATCSLSDRRLKKNIKSIAERSLDGILQLNGVRYEWIDSSRGTEPEIGLIAQDVQQQFPEATVENKRGFLGLNYESLLGPIVESIKELYSKWLTDHEKIKELERRIEQQQKIIDEINLKLAERD